METEMRLREDIIETCLKMIQMGINQGTSGNVSARWWEGMLITPTGIAYEEMGPGDIIHVDFRDNRARGPHRPSSEWRIHRDIMATRPDVHATIHTHSNHATAMAIQRMDIPAHHYMVAAAGGNPLPPEETRVPPYEFPLRYIMNGAFANLDLWVRTGTPPPRADRLVAINPGTPESALALDQFGNAVQVRLWTHD